MNTITLPVRPSDELEVVPQSSGLLFIPSQRRFPVSEGTCIYMDSVHVYVLYVSMNTVVSLQLAYINFLSNMYMYNNNVYVCVCVCAVCPERMPLFEGSLGVILTGKVGPPPLGGVTISVVLEGGEAIHTVTDQSGQYR